ncbi:MAG: hypothetical protein WCF92_00275 [bacterium]
MKTNQKGFIVPLLFTIIAILVVGGGVYIYTQNKDVFLTNEINSSNSENIKQKNSLPSISTSTKIVPSVNTKNQQDQESLQSIANVVATVASIRPFAVNIYDNNAENYSSLCSGGLINTNVKNGLSGSVKSIFDAQGVSSQSDAGIVCVATKDKYAIQVTFKKYVDPNGAYFSGKHSYCIDSTGVGGDDTKYKIDKVNYNCKAQ